MARQSVAEGVEYRDVVGFPGYRVGSDGTILTCRKTSAGITREWRQIYGSPFGKQGYIMVCFRMDGRGHRKLLHHVVLNAFVSPRPPGLFGLHGNDDPSDNRLCNLRWGTREENMRDRDRNGGTANGERSGPSKLTELEVVRIRQLAASGMRQIDIAELFRCNDRNISAIVCGQTWKHVSGPITTTGRGGYARRSEKRVKHGN